MRRVAGLRARQVIVIGVAAMTLAACGGDEEPSAPADDQGAAPAQTATPTSTATPVPTATPTPTATQDAEPAAPRRVTRKRAISIARKAAGGGRVTEVDRDEDDGEAVWEVEIRRRGVEHKVSVSVRDGEVVEHDRDRDDDDDD